MSDDPRAAVITKAYERLAMAVANAPLESTSPIRTIALRTLSEMREHIAQDPAYIEHLIEHITFATATKARLVTG